MGVASMSTWGTFSTAIVYHSYSLYPESFITVASQPSLWEWSVINQQTVPDVSEQSLTLSGWNVALLFLESQVVILNKNTYLLIYLVICQSVFIIIYLSNRMDTVSEIYIITAWYDTGQCKSLRVLKSACNSRHFSETFVQKRQCISFVKIL